MNSTYDVWADPELRDMIATEPELMAIADAIAYAGIVRGVRPRRNVPIRRTRLLVAAAVLVVAAALVLVMPWSRSSGSLADLALAAIGSGQVMHVVAETPTGGELVDVSSGIATPVYQQQEIWFAASEGLKREVIRDDDTVAAAILETPDGAYSSTGQVYDCAWIAAHPAEATRAGVSCTESGINPSTPSSVPRPRPTLDPGLAGFVDGYRQQLAAGHARSAGSGRLDGKAVDWLIFDTAGGNERVALDGTTHKPVLIRPPSGPEQRIVTVETTEYRAADFARPATIDPRQRPASGAATDAHALPLQQTSVISAVTGARWAGRTIDGLDLVRAEQQDLLTGFSDGTNVRSNSGLELDFGVLRPDGHVDVAPDYIVISEAPSRELAFGNMWGFVRGANPPAGQLYQAIPSSQTGGPGSGSLGFMVESGMFVTIRASSSALVLQAARALESQG